MRLTTFTDYSLRVLMYVAATPQRRSTIREIAQAFAVSEHHLVKVVHFLGRHGLLATTRGHGGGLRLARAPSEINVGAVVRLTEAGAAPEECFNPAVLREAMDSFYATLSRYTLADLELPR